MEDFTAFQESVYSSLLAATKTSGSLAAEDLEFATTLDSGFAAALERCNKSILGLAESLLSISAAGTDLPRPTLGDKEDIETGWGNVVDVVDYLLEKADTCLDDYTGAIKQKNPTPLPGARLTDKPRSLPTKNPLRTQNIDKPQLLFRRKVNNHDKTPFKPLLTSKPHAKVGLEESLRTFIDENLQTEYLHPYKVEIEEMEYPPSLYEAADPIPYLPFESTKAIWVDTMEGLEEMLKELKSAKEIAIDLEHHDNRSFVGIVCLMQISTREKDWIVDTLKLREELQILNEVFADPKIIKVLHGAYMDIIWLQRDLGLYVVGLFDTFHAASVLGFPQKSLAYILKKYVNFDADKKYQLADWRIRPLPQEMMEYARSDTHFLLYCYDKIRNELLARPGNPLDGTPMERALFECRATSLRRYVKDVYDEESGRGQLGWANFLKKNFLNLNPRQTEAFKAIHAWRDRVARDEDESHHYVLPKHVMINLARQMPEDAGSVLSVAYNPSQPLKLRASELAAAIRKAKAKVSDAEMEAYMKTRQAGYGGSRINGYVPPTSAVSSANASADIFASTAESALHSVVSSFWGPALGSSKWDGDAAAVSDVRFHVPLPQLGATVYVTPGQDGVKKEQDEPYHEYTKDRTVERKTEAVIVVKEVGGGRKRSAGSAVSTPSGEEPETMLERGTATTTTTTTSTATKAKRQKKSSPDATVKVEENAGKGFTPFDYSSAPSVLNAPIPESEQAGGKGGNDKDKGKKRAFNPYAAQGGQDIRVPRKRKVESEGKSKVFK